MPFPKNWPSNAGPPVPPPAQTQATPVTTSFLQDFQRQPFNPITNTSSTAIYLSCFSTAYFSVAMTAIGQSVYEEDATKLPIIGVTSPITRIIKNDGAYPVGYRDNAGNLIQGIAAGGILYATLRDNTTPAGVWSITGSNLEPGLVTVDNTFSSTYLSTAQGQFIVMDANKSIHFALISSGFAAFAVDKATGTVGTPVTVSATASAVPRIGFMITPTTAMVFYSSTTGTLIALVLSLSGTTTLAVGTPSSTLTAAGVGVEDFAGAPKIAQLDTNLFLLSYATATGAGTTSVAAWQVSSGTTATLGSAVNIVAANNVINSTTTYKLTTLTGFVNYKSGAAAPYVNSGVVVSVTNANPPVCTVASPAALTGVGSSLTAVASTSQLSATKILLSDDNNTAGSVITSVFTISGTTTTAGTLVSVETGITTSSAYTTDAATRYNPHISFITANTAMQWYFDNAGISRACVLTEAAGVVTAGALMYRSISIGNPNIAADGAGWMCPQGTSEFLTIRQEGAAGPYRFRTVAHKISAGVVTVGAVKYLDAIETSSTPSASSLGAARLSSGDYVILPTPNIGVDSLTVMRTNGDFINYRGDIKVPVILTAMYAQPTIASNRLSILGSTIWAGSTVSSSTSQLRFVMVEIAQ